MSDDLKNHIIWDNFRKGSKEALEIIYSENYEPLYNYGLKFALDHDVVKDTIQELFIELIDSGEKLSETNNIRFYLLKALRYKLIRVNTINLKNQSQISEDFEFSLLDSVENQLIKREVEQDWQNRIIKAIKKLSEKQQEIIYLRFYNELPYSEIADLFGVNIQTVRNLMSRAIKTLKDDIAKDDHGKRLILFVLGLSV